MSNLTKPLWLKCLVNQFIWSFECNSDTWNFLRSWHICPTFSWYIYLKWKYIWRYIHTYIHKISIMKKNTIAKRVVILLVILMLDQFTQASLNSFDINQGTTMTSCVWSLFPLFKSYFYWFRINLKFCFQVFVESLEHANHSRLLIS